jgi:integrase
MGVKVREKVKGSGVWWVFVNHRGKRKSLKFDSKKTATRAAEMILTQLKLGKDFLTQEKPQTPTLESYYERYNRTYMETALRHSTRTNYESSFKVHVLPELGGLRLEEITRERMEEFIASLVKKGLAKDTIRLTLAALCVLLNHAAENKVISDNPAAKLSKLYKQAKKVHEEIEPLTAEEVRLFLESVLKHSPDYYVLFLCALHTGLRSGELVGLQWGDVDFNGKFLTVRRNVVYSRVTATKTSKARRVDISDALLSELQELKRRRHEEWLAKGSNEIPEWVFCNREGGKTQIGNLKTRHFHKCLERAGLRRIRFHDLRHTFASLLIQNREPLAYVKEQMGHSSIKMTVDIYGHLVPGANRQAVNQLPALTRSSGEVTRREAI